MVNKLITSEHERFAPQVARGEPKVENALDFEAQVIEFLRQFVNKENLGYLCVQIERILLRYLISLNLPSMTVQQFTVAKKEIRAKIKFIEEVLRIPGDRFQKVGLLSEYATGCALTDSDLPVYLPTDTEDREMGIDLLVEVSGKLVAIQVKSIPYRAQPARYVFDARTEDVVGLLYDGEKYPVVGGVESLKNGIDRTQGIMRSIPEEYKPVMVLVPGAYKDADFLVYDEDTGLPDFEFVEELYNQLIALTGGEA